LGATIVPVGIQLIAERSNHFSLNINSQSSKEVPGYDNHLIETTEYN